MFGLLNIKAKVCCRITGDSRRQGSGGLRRAGLLKKCLVTGTFLSTGLLAGTAQAVIYHFSWTGVLTMQDPSGDLIFNADASANAWLGYRTDIHGLFDYNDVSQSVTFTVEPFNFFSAPNGPFVVAGATGITVGPDQMIGHINYGWNGQSGYTADMLWDTTGFNDAIALGMNPGDSISGGVAIINGVSIPIGSVLPASDGVTIGGPMPPPMNIGPTPIATTGFDLTNGGLPLIVDPLNIGGSPLTNGPFQGFNISLDIGDANTMVLQSIQTPLPAAVWLFGSGLLGLFVAARGKRKP